MSIDDEIELWKSRENDEFGKVLKEIAEAAKDYLPSENFHGIELNPLSDCITAYALDGNRLYTANQISNILANYDLWCGKDENINKLVIKLQKIAENK